MSDEEAKNETLPDGAPAKETSLGKRKTSEDNPDTSSDDSVKMSEPRKKIQKVSHSNTTDIESEKSELMSKPSFVQSKMACSCACGQDHTITLADDGTVHSFGRNEKGALGLAHNKDFSPPTPIPNLPKIKMVSCGGFFTVCVDDEGFVWSFGENNSGQLGTGNTTNFNVPQKILNIPPVFYVSCGVSHTLMITYDSNLWSCGSNKYGQLCHGDMKRRSKPQKTSFSNISKISGGWFHTLFQNNKGEIFACGCNKNGQCGLGHFDDTQIKPILIPKLPANFTQFVCGSSHNLFLDSEGNVFSVGNNNSGQLGLGHNRTQNELKKIPNIPPIKIISCVGASSYLIDFEGNLWTFGNNKYGQLGHGDETHINTPEIINTIKNIQQISYGCSGGHFIAKNSQNQIFAAGNNDWEQLGIGDSESVPILTEINSQYSTIWGSKDLVGRMCFETTTTMMKWNEEEMKKIERIQSKIQTAKINLSSNNNKIKQEFPPNSFASWNEVHDFLNEKSKQTNSKLNEKHTIEPQHQKDIQIHEMELKDIKRQIQQLQSKKKEIEKNLFKAKQTKFSFEESFKQIEKNQKILEEMCFDVSTFCKNENEMNEELSELFKQKKLVEFDCFEISKCLWKMDLTKYQSLFELNEINGSLVKAVEAGMWKQLGIEKRDFFCFSYHIKMMKCRGYSKTLLPDYEHNCCVCSHNTPEKTIHLLKEYDIPIEDDFILKNNYTAPMLISKVKVFLKDLLGKDSFSQKGIQIMNELEKWKKLHKTHLKDLKNKGLN